MRRRCPRLIMVMLIMLGLIMVVLPVAGCSADDQVLRVPEAVTMHRDRAQVQGYVLIGRDGAASLCDGLLGSYPPQCGEPRLRVVGLTAADLPNHDQDQGITWTGETVLVGTLADGVLTIRR